jgi:hypothetical protein
VTGPGKVFLMTNKIIEFFIGDETERQIGFAYIKSKQGCLSILILIPVMGLAGFLILVNDGLGMPIQEPIFSIVIGIACGVMILLYVMRCVNSFFKNEIFNLKDCHDEY